MDIVLLLKSFLGLVVVLALLIFLFFSNSKKKKKVLKESKKREEKGNTFESLESLVKVIKNKKSSKDELSEALNKIIKYHGTIHPKLGLRPHPDFDIYGEILLRICRHPNTNKNIILDFDKALEAKNEEYKKEINDFITKGLNSRGA